MTPTVQPMTPAHVRELLAWQYEGPYAMYNAQEEDEETAVAFYLDPANGYFAIVDAQGGFLGFCSFGADARVPGGEYAQEALDIGMGMRPDLTGRGQGAVYAAAVFAYAQERYPAVRQRVTIAAFNKRAQRLCRGFGFAQTAAFARPADGREFVIMIREQRLSAPSRDE